MAIVYRAQDLSNDQTVALKILKDNGSGDTAKREQRFARFKSEFNILKKLSNSPRIVKAYDFFEDHESAPFFTLEFLEGRTLADVLADDVWLSKSTSSKLSDSVKILLQVAEALSDTHRSAIAFCDLKPANIMVISDEGSKNQVKLFDFGIARDFASQLNSTDAMVGTSFYMAPEQIQGAQVDSRVDIYAFGVLTFEMLTGRKPFDDTVLFNVTASHLASNVPPMREIVPEIPVALERMVRICMEKRPSDRYSSMDEISDRLSSLDSHSVGNSSGSVMGMIKRIFLGSVSR